MYTYNSTYIPVSDKYQQNKKKMIVIRSAKHQKPRQIKPVIKNEDYIYYMKLVKILASETKQSTKVEHNVTEQTKKIMDYIFEEELDAVEDYKDVNCINIDDIINNMDVMYNDDTLFIGQGEIQYIYEFEIDEAFDQKLHEQIVIQRDVSQSNQQEISDSNTERIRYEYTDQSWSKSYISNQNSFFSQCPDNDTQSTNESYYSDNFDIEQWRRQQKEFSDQNDLFIGL